jgi:hypothetical protein
MPHKPPKLHFDKRKGNWVEKPQTFVEELMEKSDDFHAGLLVGAGVGGALYTFIMILAFATHLL